MEKNKVSTIGVLFTWMGFILVVASMSFGGGLASQMDKESFILAVISGNIVLAALAFLSGYIGSHSQLTFGSLAEKVFVNNTWKLALLYIPISLIGWYAIEAAIFGNLIADTFNFSDVGRGLFMAAAALFFSTSAYFGLRFMSKISYVLVPLVIFVSLYALFSLDDATALTFGFSETQTGLSGGIAIVMSAWIFSVLLTVPDLTRTIKKPLHAGIVGAVGVFVANTIAFLIGGFAAAYTQQYDPSLILASLGFLPLAILLSFAGIWSTNDNNMYSSALGVSKILSVPRKKTVIFLAIFGAIIAYFNPATITIMFSFLVFMGASAPPLGGVVLGSYIYSLYNKNYKKNVYAPWIGWIAASFIVFQMQGILVIPVGIILGFVFWWLLSQVLSKN